MIQEQTNIQIETATPNVVDSRATMPAMRLKDHYWFKSLKWYSYKRLVGSPDWVTRYRFDRYVRQLTSDDIAIDCGANVGYFTRILASQGTTVHAFEPDPYAFSLLEKQTASLPNVTLHNVAVGTTDATVKLFRKCNFDSHPEQATISSSLYDSKLNVDPNNFIETRQIDFTSFLSDLGQRIAILKIDIEGAEVPLLEQLLENGMLDLCDRVFVETHESRIPELAERTAKLRKLAATPPYEKKLFLDWG